MDKMVKNIAVNPDRVQELVEKGGLKPDTLRKRAKALEDLGSFLAANHKLSLDEALTNPGLEGFLMEFFESLRVEQKDENGEVHDLSPKGRTLDSLKSNLKIAIEQKTEGKVNILDQPTFPRLHMVLKGVYKNIKQQGRGDTKHFPPINKHDLVQIFAFITLITQLIQARGQPEFFDLIGKIPQEYRCEYHRLLQWCVQFIISLFDIRRGREGLCDLIITPAYFLPLLY